jgi:hypothetical protein
MMPGLSAACASSTMARKMNAPITNRFMVFCS